MANPIGFIGLGTMGAAMAGRLIEAGHQLVVFDIAADRAARWRAKGARFAASPTEIGEACATVMLSLPGPAEVEAVAEELAAAMQPGGLIVDFSTNAFATVAGLAARLAVRDIAFLDAPVSGGVAGAVKGKLAIMAGGEPAALERIKPLLEPMASRVFHVGASGMGTIAKLVNNQIFLTAAIAVQEGFVLAAKAGLGADTMLDILKSSSGNAYAGLAPLFFARDFDAAIFKLAIATKDVAVALDSAAALEVSMPLTEAALTVYRDAVADGLGDKVFYATLQVLEARAHTEVDRLRPAS